MPLKTAMHRQDFPREKQKQVGSELEGGGKLDEQLIDLKVRLELRV